MKNDQQTQASYAPSEFGSDARIKKFKVINQLHKLMVEAINRNQFKKSFDPNVFMSMSLDHGYQEGEEVEIVFFPIGSQIRDRDLKKALPKLFEARGLHPINPCLLGMANMDDPDFADTCPNITYWTDKEGRICFFGFNTFGDTPYILSRRLGNGLGDNWWLAGVPKK